MDDGWLDDGDDGLMPNEEEDAYEAEPDPEPKPSTKGVRR